MAEKLQIPDIHFLSNQSSAFVQGIVITSAHMAKGLEFDEVIIPQVDDKIIILRSTGVCYMWR